MNFTFSNSQIWTNFKTSVSLKIKNSVISDIAKMLFSKEFN